MLQRRNISNICLMLLPIIYMFIYEFYLFSSHLKYIEFISASFMIVLFSLSVFLLGFRKNRQSIMMKNIKSMVVTSIVIYFAVAYGCGLLLGFLKNAYSLTFYSIIDNIFAPIITIVCTELFRYVVISGNKDKPKFIKIITVILLLLELVFSVRQSSFMNFESLFRIVTSIALPVIMKNIVLSYLCYHVGYQTTLLYRLIMDVYVFIIPIIPDLGGYLESVFGVGFPFLIYIYSSRIIDEVNNGFEHEFTIKRFGPVDIVALSVIGCLTLLCSGVIPWYFLGVASQSMNPQISRGDVVVIEKINDKKDLKKGNIVSFYKDGREIVHRYVEVDEVDGEECYITKGDANSTVDPGCLRIEDINGVVKTKIPYLAYPRLYLSELFD